jgi:Aldose 1-epimerase
VELVLTDSEYTRKMWPHKFKAVYSVHLHGENLHTDLRIINEGDKPFTFTAALHSYFEVADIGKAKVHGLKGLAYLDKVCFSRRTTSHCSVTAHPVCALRMSSAGNMLCRCSRCCTVAVQQIQLAAGLAARVPRCLCVLQTKDANSPPEVQEEREAVDFTGPVDSVYLDAPGYVELDVGTGECSVHRPCTAALPTVHSRYSKQQRQLLTSASRWRWSHGNGNRPAVI